MWNLSVFPETTVFLLHVAVWKRLLFSKCYQIQTLLVKFTHYWTSPIPGMFVVIWMHFTWWFQIKSTNPRICYRHFCEIWLCHLLTPALWKVLRHNNMILNWNWHSIVFWSVTYVRFDQWWLYTKLRLYAKDDDCVQIIDYCYLQG